MNEMSAGATLWCVLTTTRGGRAASGEGAGGGDEEARPHKTHDGALTTMFRR